MHCSTTRVPADLLWTCCWVRSSRGDKTERSRLEFEPVQITEKSLFCIAICCRCCCWSFYFHACSAAGQSSFVWACGRFDVLQQIKRPQGKVPLVRKLGISQKSKKINQLFVQALWACSIMSLRHCDRSRSLLFVDCMSSTMHEYVYPEIWACHFC
jgi:hypothetical protein